MKIITMQVGPIQANCYILCDEATRKAAIIDPGAEAERILEQLKKLNCKADYIILTHGHFDHTSAVAELMTATDAKLVADELEAELLASATLSMQYAFTPQPYIPLVADISVKDGDSLQLGDAQLKFIHTPGHTKGGCCVICGDNIFCGDIIFKEDIGRTDLPTANKTEMNHSLKRIAALDGEYNLYPGHGEPTTLSHERKYNLYMK